MGRKRLWPAWGGLPACASVQADYPSWLDVGDPGLLSCELATTLVVAIPIHA